MTVDSQTPAESAPNWGRMPGAVRLELDREIIRHRSEHRSRYYDLLREDPRFAPWIGSQRGFAGEKRLDRYIADLRKNQPKKMSAASTVRPSAAGTGADDVQLDAAEKRGASGLDVLAGGGAAVSYQEFQTGLRRRFALNERMTAACLNDLGEVTDKPLMVKLITQYMAMAAASPGLTKSLHRDLNSETFVGRALDRILRAAPNLTPEDIEALRADLSRDFLESNGFGATHQ